MAAPVLSAVGTPTASGFLTGATVAWPTHATGDLGLLFVETTGGQTPTLSTPAGFTEVVAASTGTGTTGTRLTVFSCRATSSAMTSPVVLVSGGDHGYGFIAVVQGAADVFDAIATDVKAVASTSVTLPAVTTTGPDRLIILAASRDNDSSAASFSAWANASLASLTERSDAGTGGGNGGGIGMATGVLATAGSTGTTDATVVSSVNAMVTLAVKAFVAGEMAATATVPVTLSGALLQTLPVAAGLTVPVALAGTLDVDASGGPVDLSAGMTVPVVLAGTLTVEESEDVTLGGWDLDESQAFRVPVRLEGRLSVDVAAVEPDAPVSTDPDAPGGLGPLGLAYQPLMRRSLAYVDPPELDLIGRPVLPWEPTADISETLGRLQVVMNNTDVTFFRGVPCVVEGWTKNEPFGDASATVFFPQISSYERMNHADLVNVAPGVNIDINLVRPGGGKTTMFEGLVIGTEWEYADHGVRFECLGALYQADLSLQPPPFYVEARDIGERIADLLDTVVSRNYGASNRPVTGIPTRQRGAWGNRLTGGVQDMLSTASTDDGLNQWTVAKDPGRLPRIRLKNITDVHWNVALGQPGVTPSIKSDATMTPNVIYGEGVDAEGCHWRNSKYPNLRTDDAPVYPQSPGATYTVGATGPAITAWETRMRENGYAVTVDGVYTANDAYQCRLMQNDYGLLVDGVIGPQTWAATFDVGANGGDLLGALFRPLIAWTQVEDKLYAPNGAAIGPNPAFVANRIRVERFENFGEGFSLSDGLRSASAEFYRDFWPYGGFFFGTIELAADPEEGSRFEIEAGHNIRLRHWTIRNRPPEFDDPIFHIASVNADITGGRVSLTVAQKPLDLITLAAIAKRERDATDPARRINQGAGRQSRSTQDQIVVWDCESGAGIIPRHAIFGGLWTVIRIPAGQSGQIVRTALTTDGTEFSAGIFSKPIQPADLVALVGNPLAASDENSITPWMRNPDALDAAGCLISWGSADQPCGHYPGTVDTAVTGRHVDDATWQYDSQVPPWLWVAEYSPVSTFIEGRLYAGVQV